MNEKILKELTRIAEDFQSNNSILNHVAIRNAFGKKADEIQEKFLDTLTAFHLAKPATYSYTENANDFHKSVLMIKACDGISNKPDLEELKNTKERCLKLEKESKKKDTKIRELQDTKIFLKTRIKIHEQMYPDLKRLDVSEESEVESLD